MKIDALQDFARRDQDRRRQLALRGLDDAIGAIDLEIKTALSFRANRLRRERAKLSRLLKSARPELFRDFADEVANLLEIDPDKVSVPQWRRFGQDYIAGLTPYAAAQVARVAGGAS